MLLRICRSLPQQLIKIFNKGVFELKEIFKYVFFIKAIINILKVFFLHFDRHNPFKFNKTK